MQLFYEYTIWPWLIGPFVLVGGLLITNRKNLLQVPYGRYAGKSAYSISNRIGWFLMELPTFLMPVIYFALATPPYNEIALLLVALYTIHYLARVFVYPNIIHPKRQWMSLWVFILAMLFTFLNSFYLGYYLSILENYSVGHLTSPLTIVGLILFTVGMVINWHSDLILSRLKTATDESYKIPYGGAFKWLSSPNYSGEILQWGGYALIALNTPATAFLLWVVVNLGARAIVHHDWYIDNFEDYPKSRKRLIPKLY